MSKGIKHIFRRVFYDYFGIPCKELVFFFESGVHIRGTNVRPFCNVRPERKGEKVSGPV